jgi:glycosyltransferase involved in cell wall biosynthesis
VPLRVLIVSGIWPPDVGGPASHGPELGAFLSARGHDVEAVVSCAGSSAERTGFPLHTTDRERPLPVRMVDGGATVTRAARGFDVMYTTGMYSRSVLAARLRGLPVVLKLASDPAYERSRNLGLYDGTLESFQQANGSHKIAFLKRVRSTVVSNASHLVIPSEYLARVAREWGIGDDRISVIPNPAPRLGALADRAELRARLGVEGPTFVFGGRLVLQKNVPLAVRALAQVPDARLVIVGDGVERPAVETAIAEAGLQDRVEMVGSLKREQVLEWVRAADAALLPSDWENFPHAVVESLSVGTPVIATSVGGVPEIIDEGSDGFLVERGDADGMAAAMRTIAGDPQRVARMREVAVERSARYAPDQTFAEIEARLVAAAAAGRG